MPTYQLTDEIRNAVSHFARAHRAFFGHSGLSYAERTRVGKQCTIVIQSGGFSCDELIALFDFSATTACYRGVRKFPRDHRGVTVQWLKELRKFKTTIGGISKAR